MQIIQTCYHVEPQVCECVCPSEKEKWNHLKFKSPMQTQLSFVGSSARALDYPWSTPSLPGSGVIEASHTSADSSPQSVSHPLWKVSFWPPRRGWSGGRREGGGAVVPLLVPNASWAKNKKGNVSPRVWLLHKGQTGVLRWAKGPECDGSSCEKKKIMFKTDRVWIWKSHQC